MYSRLLASVVLASTMAAMPACSFKSRPKVSTEELLAQRAEGVARIEVRKREVSRALSRRMDTIVGEAIENGAAATYDILLLSGGGDYGAFGAGVLSGWGEISDTDWARPEFDFVTGVSTGALIAPYAYVGTDEAIETVLSMYENPKDNWLRSQTLLRILRRQESIYNVKGLHQEIRDQMTMELAEMIAEGVADDRVLLAGATNVDFGVFVPFDLGKAFVDGLNVGDLARPIDIMLASSAIPGGFPPIDIDGQLYVDGGAAVQMFFPANRASMYAPKWWATELYGENQPTVRVWAIVNNKLAESPKTTQPRLGSVIGRSLGISIRTSAILTLRDLETLALLYRAKGAPVEFRYIAVPEDFADNPGGGFFDKDTMSRLGNLGRELGRDPASWRTHVPSAEWPDEYFDGTGRKSAEELRRDSEESRSTGKED